jgi:hypothetical protein
MTVEIKPCQEIYPDYARGAAAAAPSFRYVYGSYVDEPLLRHAGTGTTLPTSGTAALYYHRNQQYSIVGLSDAAGTLVERYAYTAYGELTILAPDRTARATSSFQNRYTCKRILNYRLTPLLFSGFLLESEHGAGSRARVVAGAGG